ncbi:putative necrosis-inducing factor-domain-containing protein [Immersiella caudata]|uniref:Necrosis-inducing factor-domain-containing protein n=1 Tax=Immersiella caudata TaxID=314043 RepID=A0AA39TZ21_9PEZI|nr:putative necrosis-inducing factor-domain-containing protein [Immersiella caudata]
MLLLTTLAALLATTTASPVDLSKRLNSCGISSFAVDTSSPAAASDCQFIVNVLSQGAFPSFGWDLGNAWNEVLVYETCSFQARSIRGNRATIGNEDVYDLLRDTLRDSNRGGNVGARGAMQCNGVDVEWRVVKGGGDGGATIGFGKA